jgi:hypothetical protein
MRFRDGRLEDGAPAMDGLPAEAIGELARFRRSNVGPSTWKWLNIVSDLSTAAAFGALFWPDFVQHEGGVFLQELFDESTYRRWKEHLGGDIQAIERVMNHVHTYDLFLNPKLPRPEAPAVLYLTALLGRLWSLRATEQFGPGRIVVEVLDEEPPGTNPVLVLLSSSCFVMARGSYRRKLWMSEKGDAPFLGMLNGQTPKPRCHPGERYATYVGGYHCDGGDAGGWVGGQRHPR